MRVVLKVPAGFRFDRTVYGHGWATLSPFRFDAGGRWLETMVTLPRGGAARVRLSAAPGGVLVEAPGKPSAFLRAAARRMLNLDTDFSDGYTVEHQVFDVGFVAVMQ